MSWLKDHRNRLRKALKGIKDTNSPILKNIENNADLVLQSNRGDTDGDRLYPVDYLIIHHSGGPSMESASALEIMDAYDDIGRARGYESVRLSRGEQTIRSYHTHPLRDKETFAQAQFAMQPYNNKYGWRLIPLMLKWWDNVAWHAGHWEINRRSIGIEINGNFTSEYIDDGALRLIADAFRPHYKTLKEKGIALKVFGHKDVALGTTGCPGKIHQQLPTLKSYIFG